MKLIINLLRISLIFLVSTNSLSAQYKEIGLNSKASSGTVFGPVFNASPIVKWGKSFESVKTLRAERTYLHYSQYGGNQYGSFRTGAYYGHEYRRELASGFFLIHGPEVGGYFTSTGPYASIQPRGKYQLGILLRLSSRINLAISSPLSTGVSFERTDSQWNQTLFTFDVFNEMNSLSMTYIL